LRIPENFIAAEYSEDPFLLKKLVRSIVR